MLPSYPRPSPPSCPFEVAPTLSNVCTLLQCFVLSSSNSRSFVLSKEKNKERTKKEQINNQINNQDSTTNNNNFSPPLAFHQPTTTTTSLSLSSYPTPECGLWRSPTTNCTRVPLVANCGCFFLSCPVPTVLLSELDSIATFRFDLVRPCT